MDLPAGEVERILALDEALERLAALNPRHAQVVECRFFGGMTIEETAAALDISPATAKRDWSLVRLATQALARATGIAAVDELARLVSDDRLSSLRLDGLLSIWHGTER